MPKYRVYYEAEVEVEVWDQGYADAVARERFTMEDLYCLVVEEID